MQTSPPSQSQDSGDLTGQVKPKGNRMGLLKDGSLPLVTALSGTLNELAPRTGVTALP